jgi:hypothetical protein
MGKATAFDRLADEFIARYGGAVEAAFLFAALGVAALPYFSLAAIQTLPLAIHLLLNAVVLHLARQKRADGLVPLGAYDGLLIGLPLYGFAVIDLVLSIQAVWSGVHYALGLLVLAGAYDFVVSALRSSDNEDEAEEDEAAELPPPAPDDEKPRPGVVFMGYGVSGIFSAFWVAVVLVLLMAGFVWYAILHGTLFDGRFYAAGAVLAGVAHSLPGLAIAILPSVFAVFVILVGIGACIAAGQGLRLLAPDAKRDLTADETAFIARSTGAVATFARSLPQTWLWWPVLFVLLMCALFALPMAWILNFDQLARDWFFWTHPQPARWYLYLNDVGPAGVVGVFACILAASALMQLLVFIAPDAAIAQSTRKLRQGARGRTAEIAKMQAALTRMVRNGRLSADRALSPRDLLIAWMHRYDRYFFGAALGLVVLTGVLAWRELSAYTILAPDRIEYADYWSGRVHNVEYGEVRKVILECWTDDERMPQVYYTLLLGDGREVELFNHARLKANLDGAERIDSILRRGNAVFEAARRKGLLKHGESALEPACIENVGQELGDGPRFSGLMRLR